MFLHYIGRELLTFSSPSSFCLTEKFHGENENLSGGKQNKAQSKKKKKKDLKVSC